MTILPLLPDSMLTPKLERESSASRKYFDEELRMMDIHYFYGFVTDLGHVGVGRIRDMFWSLF
jgi:hypothetical protein